MNGCFYTATLDIVACIEPDGTLKVFSRKGGEGSGLGYLQVIEAADWDGSEVSNSVADEEICNNIGTSGCGASGSNGQVSLTVSKMSENSSGEVVVDIDWELSGCAHVIEGSVMLTIGRNGSCPTPISS